MPRSSAATCSVIGAAGGAIDTVTSSVSAHSASPWCMSPRSVGACTNPVHTTPRPLFAARCESSATRTTAPRPKPGVRCTSPRSGSGHHRSMVLMPVARGGRRTGPSLRPPTAWRPRRAARGDVVVAAVASDVERAALPRTRRRSDRRRRRGAPRRSRLPLDHGDPERRSHRLRTCTLHSGRRRVRAATAPSPRHLAPPHGAAACRRLWSRAGGGRSCRPASSSRARRPGRVGRRGSPPRARRRRIASPCTCRITSDGSDCGSGRKPRRHVLGHVVHPFSEARPGDAHALLDRAQRQRRTTPRSPRAVARRSSAAPSAAAAPAGAPRPRAAPGGPRHERSHVLRPATRRRRARPHHAAAPVEPTTARPPSTNPATPPAPGGRRPARPAWRRPPGRCRPRRPSHRTARTPRPSTVGMNSSTMAASASRSPACAARTVNASTPTESLTPAPDTRPRVHAVGGSSFVASWGSAKTQNSFASGSASTVQFGRCSSTVAPAATSVSTFPKMSRWIRFLTCLVSGTRLNQIVGPAPLTGSMAMDGSSSGLSMPCAVELGDVVAGVGADLVPQRGCPPACESPRVGAVDADVLEAGHAHESRWERHRAVRRCAKHPTWNGRRRSGADIRITAPPLMFSVRTSTARGSGTGGAHDLPR